jgi:hypothetical protein
MVIMRLASIGISGSRRRKLLAALAAALALPALALAAPAQAAPRWYGGGTLIAGSASVISKDKIGQLVFHLVELGVPANVSCAVRARETITNPPGSGAGTDEVTQFKTKMCLGEAGPCTGEYHFNPVGLPWHSQLAEEPPKPGIRDVMTGVGIEVTCSKAGAKGGKGGESLGTYSGTLNAKVGASALEFEGAEGLTGGAFGPLTVTGNHFLKGKGKAKTITAG